MPIRKAASKAAARSRTATRLTVDTHPRRTDAEHFEAAIARHRLDLQTQLKRSTSLPSAMFDASDPMLEARLCAATEGIFQKLLEWDAPRALPTGGEQRLEKIGKHELVGVLMAALHGEFDGQSGGANAPRLDEHKDEEFFAILAEAAARSTGKAQERAQSLLAAQHAHDAATIDDAARALADALTATLRGTCDTSVDGDGDAMDEDSLALQQLCERVAASVARAAQTTQPHVEHAEGTTRDEDDAS